MTAATKAVENFGLVESLTRQWIKLPMAAMKDVGPAAQTLGGIIKMTNRETFSPVSTIAKAARVPVATCRKHLATLERAGWIVNEGRQRTRSGAPRRTCTIRLTSKTKNALNDYGVLPWWACCQIRQCGKIRNYRLPWATKALLAVMMAKLMAMKASIENGDGHGLNVDDLWGSLCNMGIEDRFRWSLSRIQRDTGLSREAAVSAKRDLHRLGVVILYGDVAKDGSHQTDCLDPHQEFQVVVTSASEGRCFIDFAGR